MKTPDQGLERFRFNPPISLHHQQVIAAIWMGNSMLDYLLYIPKAELPEGGAWIDVIHATDLPNLVAGGASRRDDQLRDFELMGYYTEGGNIVEQNHGWKIEDVGGGNVYITEDGGDDSLVVPIGILVRVGRRPATPQEAENFVPDNRDIRVGAGGRLVGAKVEAEPSANTPEALARGLEDKYVETENYILGRQG